MSCITSLCTLSCWHRLELQIRHILPFLLGSVEVIVRIMSFGFDLVKLVIVDDDAFSEGRGELWVTSMAILACCRSTPAATGVLNSWKSCRV